MSRKKAQPSPPRRTREHVIADQSVNFVERLALRCGFSLQRVLADYRYDVTVVTYDESGDLENIELQAQIKASDTLARYAIVREPVFSFPVATRHLRIWKTALLPVLLILYDAKRSEAYWVDVRRVARELPGDPRGKTINVHLPRGNVLGAETFLLVREEARDLRRLYQQQEP